MHTPNKADENFQKLISLFPNAVTESVNEKGEVVRAIDKDILMQEISCTVVEGGEERYQFTWPDKKKAILAANSPISKTLRPCRAESVNFDTTENLYIEGDNLEVLKLLQETYLGKIKMIYIDPPYNTGKDFVYRDNFAQNADEYLKNSGQFDEEGNRLFQNTESNGRFHTDWLNMIYPRLKLARNLLSDDGVIFISIDDNEVHNLKKICDEIFGEINFVAQIPWRKRTAKSDVPFGVSQDYEWIICIAKSTLFYASIVGKGRKYYTTSDFPNRPWRIHDMTKQTTAAERPNSFFTMINPKNGDEYPADPNRTWRVTKDTFKKYYEANEIIFPGDYDFLRISKPVARYFKDKDMEKDGENFGNVTVSTKLPDQVGRSEDGTKQMNNIFGTKIFSFPKPMELIKYLIQIATNLKKMSYDLYSPDIILDFFSGSATTAHAVMQLNAEDGGKRKFIMVQLPEVCGEKTEACKAGYKNICEIGKERIRRAGAKIKEDNKNKKGMENLDIGFRVLKCDSSNMKDVYYTPDEYHQKDLIGFADNIKNDRSDEDLLFQVMLDLGILLSNKIEKTTAAGKTLFIIEDNYLIACFDDNITDEVITEIAKKKPRYFVMRDASAADDSVTANFDQIFAAYSPDTVRKVL